MTPSLGIEPAPQWREASACSNHCAILAPEARKKEVPKIVDIPFFLNFALIRYLEKRKANKARVPCVS